MGNYQSDKKSARFFGLKLFRNTDGDLIEYLESMDNVQSYLRQIVRADYERQQRVPEQENAPR